MKINSKRSTNYRPLQEGGGLTPRGESGRRNLLRIAVYSFSLLLSLFGACADGSPAEVSFHLAENMSATVGGEDLTTYAAGSTTLNLIWTQVSNETNNPAQYDVRDEASFVESWNEAAIVRTGSCSAPAKGDTVGKPISCRIRGPEPETSYDVQLVLFRHSNQFRSVTATTSNISTARTDSPSNITSGDDSFGNAGTMDEEPAATIYDRCTYLTCEFDGSGLSERDRSIINYTWDFGNGNTDTGAQVEHSYSAAGTCGVTLTVIHDDGVIQSDTMSVGVEDSRTTGHAADEGIWISPNELSVRTTSGNAWGNVKAEADGSCGSVNLSDQDQDNNVCILAKALVHARIGDTGYRSDVVSAIQQIASMGTYHGRALALGRELGAYAIAADLIGLTSYDPSLDSDFRAKLRELLTTYTHGGPSSLIECHEDRPNNWGTHCGASRAAVAAYLGDEGELERTAQVFKGWLGDRSAYASFDYGDDLSWQCDPNRPVGVNPPGCTEDGHNINGVLPDDQRRGGRFTWPPPKENYVWEALQGALVQATILHRAGYNVFEWQDRALFRAVRWLHETARYPAEGDDEWQPHLVNHFYGTALPAPVPARSGKNMGWTDWTHR